MPKEKKQPRSLGDLASIIGSVKDDNSKEIIEATQEFTIPKVAETPKNIEKTTEIKVPGVDKFVFKEKQVKVPESFKIKPSLKKIVEEIVTQARANDIKTSKGEIYNYLIAKALREL